MGSNKLSSNFGNIAIRIICDKESCIAGINELLSYNPIYVGFDCEWVSNRVRGENKICLIQIGHEKVILLIRIHLFSDNIPIESISFFEKVDIIECGIGIYIYGNVIKLKKAHNIDVYGSINF